MKTPLRWYRDYQKARRIKQLQTRAGLSIIARDRQGAIDEYRQILALQPIAAIYAQLAELVKFGRSVRDYKEAGDLYLRAAEMSGSEDHYLAAAIAYGQANLGDEQLSCLDIGLAHIVSSALLHTKAQLLRNTGRPDELLSFLKSAVHSGDYADPFTQIALAQAYEMNGEPSHSVATFERLLRSDKANVNAYLQYGELLVRQHDEANAVLVLRAGVCRFFVHGLTLDEQDRTLASPAAVSELLDTLVRLENTHTYLDTADAGREGSDARLDWDHERLLEHQAIEHLRQRLAQPNQAPESHAHPRDRVTQPDQDPDQILREKIAAGNRFAFEFSGDRKFEQGQYGSALGMYQTGFRQGCTWLADKVALATAFGGQFGDVVVSAETAQSNAKHLHRLARGLGTADELRSARAEPVSDALYEARLRVDGEPRELVTSAALDEAHKATTWDGTPIASLISKQHYLYPNILNALGRAAHEGTFGPKGQSVTVGMLSGHSSEDLRRATGLSFDGAGVVTEGMASTGRSWGNDPPDARALPEGPAGLNPSDTTTKGVPDKGADPAPRRIGTGQTATLPAPAGSGVQPVQPDEAQPDAGDSGAQGSRLHVSAASVVAQYVSDGDAGSKTVTTTAAAASRVRAIQPGPGLPNTAPMMSTQNETVDGDDERDASGNKVDSPDKKTMAGEQTGVTLQSIGLRQ